ncbi:hypothetical protein GCM10012275_57550 [Longimycelium tulufanense]|uniref:Uncharacterized protein n=1 Tax=Longimycelium tulufanense TaxID=907463 RepID=A0A8J3CJY4_9PSEU|nr:hypothetical protein [Longimycelium tulufanense]GGM79433.1 hypothetical protein GCM10012275_57550 [Longimycelium tulufanense]
MSVHRKHPGPPAQPGPVRPQTPHPRRLDDPAQSPASVLDTAQRHLVAAAAKLPPPSPDSDNEDLFGVGVSLEVIARETIILLFGLAASLDPDDAPPGMAS